MERSVSVICCVLMSVSVILEMLTPSMGGFTIAALGLAGSSIYFAFKNAESFGYTMVAANIVMFPLSLWLGMYLMRRSPLIHRVELTGESQNSPDAPPLTHLLGQQGRALTPLRPGGAAMIGEAKVDVVTEGKFVDTGTEVKVIIVEGNRVVVEPV
jgi:membrane-bound serine protease (ClpP class)